MCTYTPHLDSGQGATVSHLSQLLWECLVAPLHSLKCWSEEEPSRWLTVDLATSLSPGDLGLTIQFPLDRLPQPEWLVRVIPESLLNFTTHPPASVLTFRITHDILLQKLPYWLQLPGGYIHPEIEFSHDSHVSSSWSLPLLPPSLTFLNKILTINNQINHVSLVWWHIWS